MSDKVYGAILMAVGTAVAFYPSSSFSQVISFLCGIGLIVAGLIAISARKSLNDKASIGGGDGE